MESLEQSLSVISLVSYLRVLSVLEYRGYHSAGLTVIVMAKLHRDRQVGKVQALDDAVAVNPEFFDGHIDLAHTRWATHGEPAQRNPNRTYQEKSLWYITVSLKTMPNSKEELISKGYIFTSQTITEVVAHLNQ